MESRPANNTCVMIRSLAGSKDETSPEEASYFPIREKAPAKVNLTLHIRGKRPDGYHELESLVVFADLTDELTFRPATLDSLSLDGPFAGAVDGENLVFKAKRAVAAWLGKDILGAFHLQKNIPVAAGLGGGSSDAAAAIRALSRAYAGSFEVADFLSKAAAIGADVPVCLHHRAAWMRGLGERVTPITGVSCLPAILVNPRLKVSTAAVFKELSAPPYYPSPGSEVASDAVTWTDPASAADILRQGRNDLEPPAIALEPAVESVLNTLRRLDGCLLARLSGSGPTCFGLFPSQDFAVRAASAIKQDHPHWWVAAVTLS